MGPRIVDSDSDEDLELSDVGSYSEAFDDEEDEVSSSTPVPAPKKLQLKVKESRSKTEEPARSRKRGATGANSATKQRKPDIPDDLLLSDEEETYDPDANLTSRQRGSDQGEFLELSIGRKRNEEAAALRKAESARRRADYKNKAEEEEKRDTINKLLKRRAAKTSGKDGEDGEEFKSAVYKPRRPMHEHRGYWRFISTKEKEVLVVPE